MRLLPLALSARVWSQHPGEHNAVHGGGSRSSCRFCGLEAASWQERYHLNGDPSDETPDNVVSSCVLCHLAQDLLHPEIELEATLIWLPELTQGALNALARGIHLILVQQGKPPHLDRRPFPAPAPVIAAVSAVMALKERGAAANERLGTTSPRALGDALLRLSSKSYGRREALLAGTRLLPLGRLYRGGEDIYPELLKQLKAETATNKCGSAGAAPKGNGKAQSQ